jgi:hypothetical protein
MRSLSGTAGALALAAALIGVGVSAVTAQEPAAPASDRAGKERRVDFDPTEPTPAPGARRLAAQPDAPLPVTPGTVDRRPMPPTRRATPTPPIVSTHQIDRFEAIKKEQQAVKTTPNSLADWVILGELAQEVAMDLPADQAAQYFRMSSDAFEKALELDPGNKGLRAAVNFARAQEANRARFEASRDAATDVFLSARRRDLAATAHVPYIRAYSTPTAPTRVIPAPVTATPAGPATPARTAATPPPTDRAINSAEPLNAGADTPVAEASQAITPARQNAPATDAANYGTQANYSLPRNEWPATGYVGPVYVPFSTPAGVPFTYEQYSNTYYPVGIYDNPAVAPVTLQRYVPPPAATAAPNALERQILKRSAAKPVAPVAP